MENNINSTFAEDLVASQELMRKYNRQEMRHVFGGKSAGKRSKAPRNIASRKLKK